MKSFLHITFTAITLLLFTLKVSGQIIFTGFVAGSITSCQGAQSENEEIQFFPVSGIGLTGNIGASASAGFVVSTSEFSGFADNCTIAATSGGVASGMIYVRATASAIVGNISGTITFSSPGAATKYVAVTANILAMPVADTEKNITVLNGATIPRLNFEGAGSNTYLWTSSNPNIGLAASGVDSLPTFRALITGNSPATATITVTPVWAGMAYLLDPAASVVRAVNTVTNALDTTIATAGKGPKDEVLSADATRLFVLNTAPSNFSVINTLNNKLRAAFPVTVGGASAITTSTNDSLIDILAYGLITTDVNTGAVIASSTFNAPNGISLAVNPNGKEVFVTAKKDRYAGALTITDLPSGHQSAKLQIPLLSGDLLLSPDTSTLLFTNADTIFVVDRDGPGIFTRIFPFFGGVNGIAISPDGNTLYVSSGLFLEAYRMSDYTFEWQVAVSDGLGTLAVSPDGTRVYITGGSSVFVVNTLTQALISTIPLPGAVFNDVNTVTPGGCYGNPISFTITVNPAPLPVFNETGSLTAMSTTYGTPSAADNFTVSGMTLRTGILIQPPTGFEVSLDGVTFSPTVTAGGAGILNDAIVYIRIAGATVVGTYTGQVVLSSSGAANVLVTVPASSVTPADLTIAAGDITKAYGAPIPPFTLTFTGFQNGDGEAQLVYPPVVRTPANQNSPAGTYPINVSAAYSENYNITFVPGVLTIFSNVIIPNAFTPNGDGINDTWDIQKVRNYPDCTVQVFSRYGQVVYSSTGYGVPWDGKYKNNPLPAGTYYYIINLNANVPLLSGYVTIIR